MMESKLNLCVSCNSYHLTQKCPTCIPVPQQPVFEQAFQPAPHLGPLHAAGTQQVFAPYPRNLQMVPLLHVTSFPKWQDALNSPMTPIAQLPLATCQDFQPFIHLPPVMTTIGAPTMTPFMPPPTPQFCESYLELRERLFSECVSHFEAGLASSIVLDSELGRSSKQFLQNAREQFQSCIKMDEEACDAHDYWAEQVSINLNKYEKRFAECGVYYNISFHYINVFNVFLAMMHPKGEITKVSTMGADERIAEAKRLLVKFEAHLQYMQRSNYDAQGVGGNWDSPLEIAQEKFKKAQMNARIWSCLQTLPTETPDQFETVHGLLKKLQGVYEDFEKKETSIYRVKYLTSAIRFMALLIKGELEVERECAETDSAVNDLVSILLELVDVWKDNSLKTNGVISRLQQHVQQMQSNAKLLSRHLAINSWIFMLSSLNKFQQPRNQQNSDENMRGYKVVRIRLKRKDCFSDTGYNLIALWQHIMDTKAVNLQGAYFVLDHQSDDKKGKKSPERKIAGVLVYFIAETDEDALKLQKLHFMWMRPKHERERLFTQVCPELAKLQKDDFSDAEDSERRLRRLAILRKKNSLVLETKTDAQKKAFRRDEELQQYLCTSKKWCGPAGRFDKKWLERFVGGSWSIAGEKKKDPTKTDEDVWFDKMLELQKERSHSFYALPKKKTLSDESEHQEAKGTCNSPKQSTTASSRQFSKRDPTKSAKRYSPRGSSSPHRNQSSHNFRRMAYCG